MSIKKWLVLAICLTVILGFSLPFVLDVEAVSGPTIITTLEDNTIQRGSKKTFDVWARNAAGDKIRATVQLNGQKVEPTWDDTEKTSYTLLFTKEGENIVTVSASSDGGKKKELTYHITYRKANEGEEIGTAVWSIEAFTIGCGYLVYPVEMPIYEGETAAEQLIRLLHNSGLIGYYGGTLKSSFYLAYIADGNTQSQKYNSYQKSGTPAVPKELQLSPEIPSVLVPYLEDTMTFYDPDDYEKNWNGYLGEFVFTNGSGWMYSVNNIFPNVGFADSYLTDGDVVRVQFTLGYGADIGGFGAVGTEIPDVDTQPTAGYYSVANKDQLSLAICRALKSERLSESSVKDAYGAALSVMINLDATQGQVDAAAGELNQALVNSGEYVTSFIQTSEGSYTSERTDSVESIPSQNISNSQQSSEISYISDHSEEAETSVEEPILSEDISDFSSISAPFGVSAVSALSEDDQMSFLESDTEESSDESAAEPILTSMDLNIDGGIAGKSASDSSLQIKQESSKSFIVSVLMLILVLGVIVIASAVICHNRKKTSERRMKEGE